MASTVTIYTLTNPANNRVFYVGKTSMSLGERLSCHVTCKNTSFHLSHFIKGILKQTGRRPIIDELDRVEASHGKKYEEYWIQQFKAWGFELENKRHFINPNSRSSTGKPKWITRLTEEESTLIKTLYRAGDAVLISQITGVSDERVRQLMKHHSFSSRYKDKIVGFYKDRANQIYNLSRKIA